MGFYSGVYSGICKIGLKSYKTSLCCHPNSSAVSGTYTHVKRNVHLSLAFAQGLVKGAILCFRNPYFYFRHGESTSKASQL